MSKVLVLGSNGQVGCELKKIAPKNYIFIGKKKININNFKDIKKIIEKIKPRVILNLAAFTNVDLSEIKKWDCINTNYLSTINLVDYLKKKKIMYFYLSTDYVFDGKKKNTYKENDLKKPLNFYGLTKSLSENYIIQNSKKYLILRTSWIYSSNKSSFLNKVAQKLKKNETIYGVSDSLSGPTSAFNLSNAVIYCIKKKIKNRILHYSDRRKMSPYQFIVLIKKNYPKSKSKIKKIKHKNLNIIANRPKYSYLGISKLIATVNNSPTTKEINKYISDI